MLGYAHKRPKVKDLFPAGPCAHIHYAPVYASWLRQAEGWFALLAQRMISSAYRI